MQLGRSWPEVHQRPQVVRRFRGALQLSGGATHWITFPERHTLVNAWGEYIGRMHIAGSMPCTLYLFLLQKGYRTKSVHG